MDFAGMLTTVLYLENNAVRNNVYLSRVHFTRVLKMVPRVYVSGRIRAGDFFIGSNGRSYLGMELTKAVAAFSRQKGVKSMIFARAGTKAASACERVASRYNDLRMHSLRRNQKTADYRE